MRDLKAKSKMHQQTFEDVHICQKCGLFVRYKLGDVSTKNRNINFCPDKNKITCNFPNLFFFIIARFLFLLEIMGERVIIQERRGRVLLKKIKKGRKF